MLYRPPGPVAASFLAKVKKGPGCWEWTASVDGRGYGQIGVVIAGRKTNARAHRVSYELNVGPITGEWLVCHKCDNRRCVRPDHLYLGTHKDNMADCARAGRNAWQDPARHPRGERQWAAKLTREAVRDIRLRCDALAAQLAEQHGVSVACIKAVRDRRNWAHVK